MSCLTAGTMKLLHLFKLNMPSVAPIFSSLHVRLIEQTAVILTISHNILTGKDKHVKKKRLTEINPMSTRTHISNASPKMMLK